MHKSARVGKKNKTARDAAGPDTNRFRPGGADRSVFAQTLPRTGQATRLSRLATLVSGTMPGVLPASRISAVESASGARGGRQAKCVNGFGTPRSLMALALSGPGVRRHHLGGSRLDPVQCFRRPPPPGAGSTSLHPSRGIRCPNPCASMATARAFRLTPSCRARSASPRWSDFGVRNTHLPL